MDAATLNCPMCGAAARDAATQCGHCGARLATTSCPVCFGLVFTGSKHCPHCGAKAERTEQEAAHPTACPRCQVDLQNAAVGDINLHECPKCEGLWLDSDTFETICADRERQAAVIGTEPAPPVNPQDFDLNAVRYVGCCVCGKLMNRVNFASRSGVILDVCKPHGIWFDREELRHIAEFIRGGGLEKSRARDRERWESERRRVESGRRKSSSGGGGAPLDSGTMPSASDVIDFIDIAASVGRVVWKILD